MKLIIDGVVACVRGDPSQARGVWGLVLFQLGVALVSDLLGRATNLVDVLLSERVTIAINVRMLGHAAKLDVPRFEDPDFQDILERARRHSRNRIEMFAPLLDMLQDTLTLLILLCSLAAFSPFLFLMVFMASLPTLLAETHFQRLAHLTSHLRTPDRRLLEYLYRLSTNPKTAKETKIFGLNEHFARRYRTISDRMLQDTQRIATKRVIWGVLVRALSTATYYCAYALVLRSTMAGTTTIGTFTFLTVALSRVRNYVESVLSSLSSVARQSLSLKDVMTFFEVEPAVRSMPRAIPAPRPIRLAIEFQGVSFSYPGCESPALSKITLRLERGESIALTGRNGAGKTTFIKLLARLYDPTEGRILLDGIDLREYDIRDLHRQISIIFQDFVRYEFSLRDNIGFGQIDRLEDDAWIKAAAQKSGADTLKDKLPNGYDQILGTRFRHGIGISGGEWQKIALARAYMRDPQILIMDEAGAALDGGAEQEVFDQFRCLARDRFSIFISHRFATIRNADRIIVLEGGHVQEQGTHDDLISRGGRYARLFRIQAVAYR